MATHALLLCGDEKAVHAVTQILDELEISFEHSGEPPFALKRLAARRFELLIVDCDNVQNATQVFNSARASNLNKTSIAIAIVEGKAGVPSAFRLGASLVLTKPVSLEQARNTLRTGIGMSRKDALEAKAPVPPAVVPGIPTASAVAPLIPASITATPVTVPTPAAPPAILTPVATVPVPGAKAPVPPAPITSPPVIPASPTPAPKAPDGAAKTEVKIPAIEKPLLTPALTIDKPASTLAPVIAPGSNEGSKLAQTTLTAEKPAPSLGSPVLAKAAAAATGVAPAGTSKFDSVFADPATSREETKSRSVSSKTEVVKTEGKDDEKVESTLRVEDPLADDDNVLDPIRDNGVPSFGTTQSFAGLEKEKRGRGLLIAAVLLVMMGAGAYSAWMTQPTFRDLVTFEYREVAARIAAFRGQPQPGNEVPPKPLPTQEVPAQATLQTPQTPPAAPADANAAGNVAASAAANANPNSTLAPTSASASAPPLGAVLASTSAPSQVTNATGAANPKGPSIQTAKQEPTSSHGTPTAVPATAATTLPRASAGKTAATDLVEVPEDFADDLVVHRVHPTYPKQARAKKLHGAVVLQAVVNKQGKVDSLQLLSGDSQLAQAAAEAVKQWRYKPYSRNGEPTDFQTKVTVDFKPQ